jgi:uncharacterized membrane protein YhhN
MASTAFFIFSFLCLACVVVLVWACRDSKANWPLKAASKTAAALCFIGAAAAQYIRVPTANQNERTYGFWIIVALVFSLGGDVALLFDDKQAFLAGLALFLIAHVCYIVAFARSKFGFDVSAAFARFVR